MAMRSQIYEWDASRTDGGGSAIASSGTAQAGRRLSIFVGGFGNNITKPAETTATEFVVIEDIAISPSSFMKADNGAEATYRGLTQANGLAGGRSFVQVRINTTDYFLDPDNIPNDGILARLRPTPEASTSSPRSTSTRTSTCFPVRCGTFSPPTTTPLVWPTRPAPSTLVSSSAS